MTASTARTRYDDIALGVKVIGYATQALGFVAATAITMACSSAIVAAIVGFISYVVLGLLGEFFGGIIACKMDTKHVAAIGATTHSVMFKLGGLFARKAAPSQVAA